MNDKKINVFPIKIKDPELTEGEIKIAFGLKAQGKYDFVERAIKDNVGWDAIGKAIGWIGFGVVKSYYVAKYDDLFKNMGLLMVDVNHDQREGWAIYNPETQKLNISKETIEDEEDRYSIRSLLNKVKRVQFIVKDKEKFEKSSKTLPELYLK